LTSELNASLCFNGFSVAATLLLLFCGQNTLGGIK